MLNRARSDPEWVKPAICLLIEIYLNIGNELVWEEVNLEGTNPSSEEGIKAAWKLLGENRYLSDYFVDAHDLPCNEDCSFNRFIICLSTSDADLACTSGFVQSLKEIDSADIFLIIISHSSAVTTHFLQLSAFNDTL